AISQLSKFDSCPIMSHHLAIGRMILYLQQTKTMGIRYKATQRASGTFPEPVCYMDSDWAGDHDSRCSTGGFCHNSMQRSGLLKSSQTRRGRNIYYGSKI